MRPTTINTYAAIIQALTTEPNPTDGKIWRITPEEWIEAVCPPPHEKAGGGFAIAVVRHWYGMDDTYDWHKDDSGAGIESEYGDRTIYMLKTARAIRREITTDPDDLLRNESARPDVYIVTARDMERVRDMCVSWGNHRAWDGCSCSRGVDFTPCAKTECTLCSGYMTATEIAYIREHAIR